MPTEPKLVNGNLTNRPDHTEDIQGLPENSQKVEEGGGSVMGDPILFWTLFAVLAVNVIVVAFALISARR
jgi:hypothetical protein